MDLSCGYAANLYLFDRAASKKHQESLEETERGGRLTAFDLEDEWEAETKLFSPASRITGF